MRALPARRRFWFNYRFREDCGSAFAYWLWYALAEPRDFIYTAPGRVSCRLFKHHNVTCRGRRDHPRR